MRGNEKTGRLPYRYERGKTICFFFGGFLGDFDIWIFVVVGRPSITHFSFGSFQRYLIGYVFIHLPSVFTMPSDYGDEPGLCTFTS